MANVGVLGAGSWGTALAALAAERADTLIWARRRESAARRRRRYAPRACRHARTGRRAPAGGRLT